MNEQFGVQLSNVLDAKLLEGVLKVAWFEVEAEDEDDETMKVDKKPEEKKVEEKVEEKAEEKSEEKAEEKSEERKMKSLEELIDLVPSIKTEKEAILYILQAKPWIEDKMKVPKKKQLEKMDAKKLTPILRNVIDELKKIHSLSTV